MAKYIDLETLEPLDDGDIFIQNTMTNADRIRGMTDDELAEWLKFDCPTASIARKCTYTDKSTDDCKNCWLDWLKQEVDDG